MANFDVYLEAPVPGASPYKTIVTPILAGTEVFRVFAGRLEDLQNQHWKVVRGAHTLVCSGDAANRKIAHKHYIVKSGTLDVQWAGYLSSANITANQTAELAYVPEVGLSNANDYLSVDVSEAVRLGNAEFLFKGVDRSDFYISLGEAADLQQLTLTFKYLNYELGIEVKE